MRAIVSDRDLIVHPFGVWQCSNSTSRLFLAFLMPPSQFLYERCHKSLTPPAPLKRERTICILPIKQTLFIKVSMLCLTSLACVLENSSPGFNQNYLRKF